MARIAGTVTSAAGPQVNNLPAVTMNTGNADGYYFPISGNDLLIVLASGSHTVTLKGAANKLGRTADKAVAMTNGQVRIFGPIKDINPWLQTSRRLHVDVGDASLKVGCIKL